MKNHLIQSLLCVALLGMMSCRADVDIANIDDPSVKLSFGAALPVGEMSARLGDFLGNVDFGEMVYVREDGVLCLSYSMHDSLSIDSVDMTEYFEPASAKLVVGDLLPDWLPVGEGPLIGNGNPIVMTCPIGISLGGINQPGADERIDSAVINLAQFNAMISIENMPGMTYDKIERVEMILPDEFHRVGGNTINVELEGKGYNQQIPVNIDNFTLDLVDEAAGTNIDSLTLTLRFELALANGETIMIQRSSAFNFNFAVSAFDYAAVYGFFDPSSLLTSETLSLSFGDMLPEQLATIKLPFADPKIDLAVETGIGAPLGVHIDHLSATDRNNKTNVAYATWDGSKSTDLLFTNLIEPNDPFNMVKRNEFHFSKDPAEGHIDNLFTVEPSELEFGYNVFINPAAPQQMRLTKETKVKFEADMAMPFEFNPGLTLSLRDTLTDVNIDKISLDSLVANAKMVDSIGVRTLQLVMTVKNMMPFNIQLVLNALNGDNQQVMELQPLLIAAPTDWDDVNHTLIPGENKLVINVREDKLEKLSEVKKFVYTATLCDTNQAEGMTNVPAAAYPIALSEQGGLSMKIAVVADLDAYLRLQF